MDVARYLLRRLGEAGLRHLFAVPGDYASPFLMALDADPLMERVPTIGELGAAYAADGYARVAGIGAACVQYGVGTFSALNGAAGSYVERVPVAIISASPAIGDRLLERQRQILFHHSTGDLDANRAVYAHVTVAAAIVTDPDAAPAQIDAAITAMLTHRRPIYLEVAHDCWTAPCRAPHGRLAPVAATSDPASLAALVEAAWARIAAAVRPVLWFGVEIARFGLAGRAQRLVDASGLPFTTTSLGKTALDEAQPAFIGTYAGPASPDATRAVMADCDCPVALGAIVTDDYLAIMAARYADMVAVGVDQARVGIDYYPRVALGDVIDALTERFLAAPRAAPAPPSPPPDLAPAPAPLADADADAPLGYQSFYDGVTRFLADRDLLDEVVLVLGESTSLYVFGNLMGLPPGGFVAQAAWGSLGHETGCALGVALASGKRPWVVAGDGGFMMTCQELSSLARAGVDAAVFVMSNRGYAIEQAFVDLAAFAPGGRFAPFDELPAWDYLALARAFGVRGYRVATTGELAGVLAALEPAGGGPALIEVVIPPHDLAPQLKRLAEPPPTLTKYKSD